MFGHQEVSILCYLIGIFPLIIILSAPGSEFIKILVIFSLIFTLFGIVWINYLISYNDLGPAINRINPSKEIVWGDISKSNLFSFTIAKKGPYGQTKGLRHGQKADVIDKGDFPLRLKNGNPMILTHEMMSHNVNPKEAIGWKQLFKKHKVSTGEEAYKKAMEGD